MIDFCRGRWSPRTQAVYAINWRDWERFCGEHKAAPLPADDAVLAAFLRARAETHSTASVSQRLAAIVAAHELEGCPLRIKGSVIKDAWAEIRRTKGMAKNPKAALVSADIKRMIRAIPADRIQDRALLLFGFATAMRRSEIVALNVEDLAFDESGLVITIRRSKTDKDGMGQPVAILRRHNEWCPVAALEAWLTTGISGGAVWRTSLDTRMDAATVALLTKRYAAKIGLDPARIGAHSLRRGCVTEMFRRGIDIKHVMAHSRHKTVGVAMGYVEAMKTLENPALKALGL
jgi:integrase